MWEMQCKKTKTCLVRALTYPDVNDPFIDNHIATFQHSRFRNVDDTACVKGINLF
jgi:hypothetical protein